jgi:hypothetical protein
MRFLSRRPERVGPCQSGVGGRPLVKERKLVVRCGGTERWRLMERMDPVSLWTTSGRKGSAARRTLDGCIRYHAGLWRRVGRREDAGLKPAAPRGKQHTRSRDRLHEGRKQHQWWILMSNMLRRRGPPGGPKLPCDAGARMGTTDATVMGRGMRGAFGVAGWGRGVRLASLGFSS